MAFKAMVSSGFARVGAGESALLRPVAILAVLLGVAASAQPLPPTRERQERRVALSGSPAEPVPELRVAAGITTLLLFDAPLDRGSVELEGRERFRLVDVGERILALEPAVDLGPGERLGLRVRFTTGASSERGVFALVAHASEVDTRVEVFRRRDSIEALQAELAEVRSQLAAKDVEMRALRLRNEASGPLGMAMSRLLDDRGVRAKSIFTRKKEDRASTLFFEDGLSFRARTWAVVSVSLRNEGRHSWAPAKARFVNAKNGVGVRVLGMRLEPPQLEPGESGRMVVETETPSWPVGDVFHLELLDEDGTVRARIPGVSL
ncbi:DUF2381 family protein [Myxococcus sp. CA039A]|uniref:DUF2381 family protein n=1 Tax=Myxococcus sp. CA039A TaxID=2741737 RepID=UPI00157A38E3|nr:DUF2381 family protein [Myxococcus sp. CA039A]NTX57534.1 DUF2381 family protein [Myxococcus sp. CA039A]